MDNSQHHRHRFRTRARHQARPARNRVVRTLHGRIYLDLFRTASASCQHR